ncbi:MAG: PH-like domain-containing protein [Leucobacter sp.]
MNRLTFLILWILIAAAIFSFMLIAWRARKRRDANVRPREGELSGSPIAEFTHVSYVSTTPVGEPFVRVAVPGLSFKGWADVSVREDGVSIEVTGEPRINIEHSQIRGTDTARGRIGKIVERDGLSLLQWEIDHNRLDHRSLESSFRFDSPAEQRRFSDAISQLAPHTDSNFTPATETTQEDA